MLLYSYACKNQGCMNIIYVCIHLCLHTMYSIITCVSFAIICFFQDHNLVYTSSAESRTRGWDKLSVDQQQQLREMRKRQRTEDRRRKILRADDEGVRLHLHMFALACVHKPMVS